MRFSDHKYQGNSAEARIRLLEQVTHAKGFLASGNSTGATIEDM